VKIKTIGRGNLGGTLGRLWASAGHEVTQLGRDGGDASDADVVLLAVPSAVVPGALAAVTGLNGKVIFDATNRVGSQVPPAGHQSIAEYVKSDYRWASREGLSPQLRRHLGPGDHRLSGSWSSGLLPIRDSAELLKALAALPRAPHRRALRARRQRPASTTRTRAGRRRKEHHLTGLDSRMPGWLMAPSERATRDVGALCRAYAACAA
jgi:hypothetical protein